MTPHSPCRVASSSNTRALLITSSDVHPLYGSEPCDLHCTLQEQRVWFESPTHRCQRAPCNLSLDPNNVKKAQGAVVQDAVVAPRAAGSAPGQAATTRAASPTDWPRLVGPGVFHAETKRFPPVLGRPCVWVDLLIHGFCDARSAISPLDLGGKGMAFSCFPAAERGERDTRRMGMFVRDRSSTQS